MQRKHFQIWGLNKSKIEIICVFQQISRRISVTVRDDMKMIDVGWAWRVITHFAMPNVRYCGQTRWHWQPQRSPGKHSCPPSKKKFVRPSGEKIFELFFFISGAFWCTLYFWASAGPANVAGPGVAYPFYPTLKTGLTVAKRYVVLGWRWYRSI